MTNTFHRASLLLLFATAVMNAPGCMAQTVSDQDVREEYEFEKAVMDQQSEFLLSQIVTSTEQEALGALQRLKDGEAFSDVASAVSIDPSAKRKGGDIGWLNPNDLSEKIRPSIRKLSKNQYLQRPVETRLGWHIVLLRDIRQTPFESFESMKVNLAKSLKERYDQIISTSPYKGLELVEMFFNFPSGPSVVRRLIDNKVDLELRGTTGSTPLIGACMAGSLPNLQLLLAAKADPKALSKQGYSPLELCILNKSHSDQLATALLDGGAQPDQLDAHGQTALDYAAVNNLPIAAELLLQRGASVDLAGRDGMTPLMHAANSDAQETVAVLLKHGADPLKGMTVSSGVGNTAVTWAFKGDGRSHTTLPALREVAADLVRKKSSRNIEAYIVQAGVRHVMDGTPLTLKRAPFTLEVRLNQGKDVMLHTAYDNELIMHLAAPGLVTDLGNASYAVHLGDSVSPGMVISNPHRFAYQHLLLQEDLPLPRPSQMAINGASKGMLQINYFEELATPEDAASKATRKLDFSQLNRPLYLVAAVGESIGFPYTIPTQYRWSKISWK